MRRRVLFAMILQTLFVCAVAAGQPPKAIITGPKEAQSGDLIVLDASESTGTSRLWLLAVAPVEKSFLPVDQGLRCVFATGTPGKYTFVLVVAGTNANGGAVAEMTTHSVVVFGGTSPGPAPDPGPGPDPTNPPLPTKPTAAVYIYEKDRSNPPRAVQAALDRLNQDDGSGIVGSIFEQDATTGAGQVPSQYRAQLQAAKAAGLPCLVVSAGDQVLRVVADPQTEADVLEAVK